MEIELSNASYKRRLELFGANVENNDTPLACQLLACCPKIRIMYDRTSVDSFSEIHDWCNDRFGYNWVWVGFINWREFYFLNPEDATLFALTFGGG